MNILDAVDLYRFYHAGDTAYFEGFREIGRRFPGIDAALLPIGAYHPESFRHVHMGPDEAVRAFKELGAKWLVPMHYGTFPALTGTPGHLRELLASTAVQVLELKPGETAA
jgi:L-ascorbate metabolism protein UlaG (beta-lactamase superfamily)